MPMMEKEEMERRLLEADAQKWYQRFEVVKGSGVYTPGRYMMNPGRKLADLNVEPSYFKYKRVLDVGANAGELSFFLEDCSARVVALDPYDPDRNGFNVVHSIRRSKVRYVRASVYDLDPDEHGYFDDVAFYGLFYHLQHPLLALQKINSVCKPGALLIGGGTSCDRWFHADDDKSWKIGADFQRITKRRIFSKRVLGAETLNALPLCGFAESTFFRDPTIWFVPNRACLVGWLKASGFEVDMILVTNSPLFRWFDNRAKHLKSRNLRSEGTLARIINKIWKKRQRMRSGLQFKAHHVGPPKPEWDDPNMQSARILKMRNDLK